MNHDCPNCKIYKADIVTLMKEIRMLKESRAAAVEQEQYVRVQLNACRTGKTKAPGTTPALNRNDLTTPEEPLPQTQVNYKQGA